MRREENWRERCPVSSSTKSTPISSNVNIRLVHLRQIHSNSEDRGRRLLHLGQHQNEFAPSPAKREHIWSIFGENCSISSKSIPGMLNFVFIFGENCRFLFRFLPNLTLGFSKNKFWIMLVNGGAYASLLSFVCLQIVFYHLHTFMHALIVSGGSRHLE